MALLTDLPFEILALIYELLGSVDDVHSLGLTCRKTHGGIHQRSDYLAIMRSVISHAPQHRYDFQLSKMLDLRQNIVTHFDQSSSRLPATQPQTDPLNSWESELSSAFHPSILPSDWPEKVICDVLARYQGLRVLEEVWLARQLEVQDYLSTDDTQDAQKLFDNFNALVTRDRRFRDGQLGRRCLGTPHTQFYNDLNTDQRSRFYAAVIHVWLLNEVRWVLTHFVYPTGFGVQIQILENCKALLAKEQATPLLDSLERDSMFKFLYHHLLPRHILFLADRDSSKLPFTFKRDVSGDKNYCIRYVFASPLFWAVRDICAFLAQVAEQKSVSSIRLRTR